MRTSTIRLGCILLVLQAVLIGRPTKGKTSPVIINEVLANEPGSAVALEWVEIYNRSDTTVDMSGFVIIDAKDTTMLTGVSLPPGEYAILARRLIGDPGQDSYESYWGDNSGVWGNTDIEEYLALQVSLKLRNSADTVELRGPDGNLSVFFWDSDAGDGVSWERLQPDSPDETASFSLSVDPSGCTPGQINSQTPRPNDLAIDSAGVTILPYPPREGGPLSITIRVENVGLGRSNANTLSVADDENLDGSIADEEILVIFDVPALGEGESTTVTYEGMLSGGIHHLIITLGDDGNSANNIVEVTLKVTNVRPEVVINEYLPDPPPGGCEEWIELYNRSGQPVDLNGWQIGDSVAQSVIITEAELLGPGEYLVVCGNLAAMQMVFPEVDGFSVYEISPWRTLNNSGDRIVLLDNFGFVVDSLTYAITYGGERSIERIDPDRPSGEAGNWWGSVDSSGATPGRKNSTAVEYSEDLKVTITPNPFRQGDEVVIGYAVPFRTSLTVCLYDINGREVRTLLDARSTVAGEILWDGTDENGQVLSPGIYVFYFETDRGTIKKIALAVSPAE